LEEDYNPRCAEFLLVVRLGAMEMVTDSNEEPANQ
jgi:hypothetical protein